MQNEGVACREAIRVLESIIRGGDSRITGAAAGAMKAIGYSNSVIAGNADSRDIKPWDSLLATCELIEAIAVLRDASSGKRSYVALSASMELAASWLRLHFMQHPEDRKGFSDYIQSNIRDHFPWKVARPSSEGIGFLYNFSPFQDTGATVASKRIRDNGVSIDVISCSFLHRKKMDQTVEALAEPYVNDRHFLDLDPSWDTWEKFTAFMVQGCKLAEEKMVAGASYSFIYSRAMWAASIFAAAKFKMRHPEIRWIAEFSDPLSLDVEGMPRGREVPADKYSKVFLDRITVDFPDAAVESLNVFSLAEHLVYVLADEIIFTNENQKKVMVKEIQSAELRRRADEASRVENHPTVPRGYYESVNSDYEVRDDLLNLAYFGEFYSSRGITEVTAALRSLPVHLRDRVNLHVFTNYIPASGKNRRPRQFSELQFAALVKRAIEGVGASGIEHLVHLNASLPYLEFLSITDKFDYLIVSDARSGSNHNWNPYLPSKWSDYSGSQAKTWGFVEEGSILASKPIQVKTPVGDSYAARLALWDMVLQKFPDLENGVDHDDC